MLHASALIFVAMAVGAWISVFYIQKAAAMDPHNPWAITCNVVSALKVTLVLVAALATAGASKGHPSPDIAGFLGMFALAQTVSVPFVSGSRITIREEPDRLSRILIGIRESIADGIILKVAVVLFALLMPDSIGLYVVVPVILSGSLLVSGKVFLAAALRERLLLRHSLRQDAEPPPDEPLRTPNAILAVLAYIFGCIFVLVVIQKNGVVIDPANWMGWTGFLVGAVFSQPWHP